MTQPWVGRKWVQPRGLSAFIIRGLDHFCRLVSALVWEEMGVRNRIKPVLQTWPVFANKHGSAKRPYCSSHDLTLVWEDMGALNRIKPVVQTWPILHTWPVLHAWFSPEVVALVIQPRVERIWALLTGLNQFCRRDQFCLHDHFACVAQPRGRSASRGCSTFVPLSGLNYF